MARRCRGRSGACAREFLVVAGLPDGDRGKAPCVEEPPQPLVASRIVRGLHCLLVLAEERGQDRRGESLRRESDLQHLLTYVTELALAAEPSRLPGWHVICAGVVDDRTRDG